MPHKFDVVFSQLEAGVTRTKQAYKYDVPFPTPTMLLALTASDPFLFPSCHQVHAIFL